MLIDVMDFDPRNVANGYGWHCNFHFGYGHDVILEEAMNERSCIQALQCLIPKAETEINDLEDELAILECQLKWSKSDSQRVPYEVCCATFKQKIESLSKLMKNLREKKISKEDDMDIDLEVQRPAERIYDVINALTKKNFSAPIEQVENLANEMNSVVNSVSTDIATNPRHTETTSDLSMEFSELITNFERQFKPGETTTEESSSDVSRYVIEDSFEIKDRDFGKFDVEVTTKVEVDAFECISEGRNGFNTCFQECSNIQNSKSNAFQIEETEECINRPGPINNGSGSTPLIANTQTIVKVEVNDHDISMIQNLESQDQIEGQQAVKENQFLSTDRVEITYDINRKQSGLSAILKPQGRKVQKKSFNGAKNANPNMLKPQGKIGKANFPPKVDNNLLQETILQKKAVDFTRPEEVNVSDEEDLYDHSRDLVVCLEAPLLVKRETSPINSSPENLHNGEVKSTILDITTKESLPCDLESLKSKLSQQPDFLHRLKIPDLKIICKFNKVLRFSKLKKGEMIEELVKLLNAE